MRCRRSPIRHAHVGFRQWRLAALHVPFLRFAAQEIVVISWRCGAPRCDAGTVGAARAREVASCWFSTRLPAALEACGVCRPHGRVARGPARPTTPAAAPSGAGVSPRYGPGTPRLLGRRDFAIRARDVVVEHGYDASVATRLCARTRARGGRGVSQSAGTPVVSHLLGPPRSRRAATVDPPGALWGAARVDAGWAAFVRPRSDIVGTRVRFDPPQSAP